MVTKEEAKKEIAKLIEKYNKVKEDGDMISNERQICDSLIRPFFRDVLGWNIEDPYEFKSEYGQGGKRIDYLACIEGVSQFIIEAKAPSREIKEKIEFYHQAINYAEGKGRDFAILTNFKTFIILRAGIDTKGVLANEIRSIDLLNLKDSDLDFLLYFGKDFWTAKGDQNPLYSEKNLKKKKPIDDKLVDDLTKWRERLLGNIKSKYGNKYNFEDEKQLEQIEEEVQRFIDRLIFICYCEDKQINDNELKPLLIEYRNKHLGKTFLMPKLKKVFETYSRGYDSDLFKNGLCDEFDFDDIVLSAILEDLRGYFEGLPYDFSVIDADILGRAYENFLGHILMGKKRFKEKEDVGKRKKMGIYYTPEHIVNYIVKNTVREKIKSLSFKDILKIKIVDPACGSGSFLIKAFDVLVEESKIKLKRELTYEEKKDLMLNCIYGVDLDERACDIAKLNLSLKLATRGERLPQFHNNIQNGNSLIGDENIAGDKAFNWEKRFPFKFDIVIGNPPWSSKINSIDNAYLSKTFDIGQKNVNLCGFFTIRGLNLLKKEGIFGFLLPKVVIKNEAYSKIRERILKHNNLFEIADFGQFPGVASDAITLFVDGVSKQDIKITFFDLKGNITKKHIVKKSIFLDNDSFIFSLSSNDSINNLLIKMKMGSKKLSDVLFIKRGIELGQKSPLAKCKKCGVYNEAKVKYYGPNEKKCKKCGTKLDIEKNLLQISSDEKSNVYTTAAVSGNQVERYNISAKYFIPESLEGIDYKIGAFKDNKILIRRIATKIEGTFDKEGLLAFNTVYSIYNPPKNDNLLLNVLAILNSKLINFFYEYSYNIGMNLTTQVTIDFLSKIPIRLPNSTQEKKIAELVNQMLELQKKYPDEKVSGSEKARLQDEIKKIDDEIDQEVYKLYGITKEEQKIIEESLK